MIDKLALIYYKNLLFGNIPILSIQLLREMDGKKEYYKRSITSLCLMLAVLLAGTAACTRVQEEVVVSEIQKESEKVITNGSKVSIEYTLYLEDGTTADTNVGKDPLVYEQGASMIISGLELRLEGLKVGDTKKVEIPPEEAYGVVDPEAFKEVPKDTGTMLQTRTQDGRVVPLKVHEVKEDTVVLDYNHPLAGERLTFDVKILDIQ
jgi:FKBP-type peptidyl-prolyl cis-trans isomerase 2